MHDRFVHGEPARFNPTPDLNPSLDPDQARPGCVTTTPNPNPSPNSSSNLTPTPSFDPDSIPNPNSSPPPLTLTLTHGAGEAWKLGGSSQWRVLSDARVKDVLGDFTLGGTQYVVSSE